MRAPATALVVLAMLALLPAAALAKTGISLNPPPDGLMAGEPWDVSFEFIRNDAPVDPARGAKPSVMIWSDEGGPRQSFEAHRTYKGLWMARVYFPRAGVWHYSIRGFGGQAGRQEWDPVTIAPAQKQAPPAVTTSSSGDGSFPYGWAGGGAALVLLAAGLVVVKLRSS
jgi:hypothetical protein